jgi:hypothetical protein
VQATLKSKPLTLAPGAADAAQEHALLLLPRLRLLHRQRTDLTRRISAILEELASAAEGQSEHRDAAILLSLPGLGRKVAATMLSEASQAITERDYHALRCYSGAAPVPEGTVCILLELKSKMTKAEARDALRVEISKQTGQNLGGRTVLKDSSTTFEWFVRNRYFPLRKGDWRPETAKEKMAQIELDLIAKFGDHPLDTFDRFMLQTHVNGLAERYSQDRVRQARSYLKSIFDEAVEQEFLVKDPTRKLKIPKNLRPKDKSILSWEQMW